MKQIKSLDGAPKCPKCGATVLWDWCQDMLKSPDAEIKEVDVDFREHDKFIESVTQYMCECGTVLGTEVVPTEPLLQVIQTYGMRFDNMAFKDVDWEAEGSWDTYFEDC